MGPVEFQPTEDEETGECGVILGELSTGSGLSWHARISLPPDRAEIQLEAKVFNRERRATPYDGGLIVPEGIAVKALPGTFSSSFRRHGTPSVLAPRQVDNWACALTPTALANPTFDAELVGSVEDGTLRLEATMPLTGCKVVLLHEASNLEAPADFPIGAQAKFQLPEAVEAVVVLGSDRRDHWRWPSSAPASATYDDAFEAEDEAGYRLELSRADNRGAACIGLAYGALRRGRPEEALVYVDDVFLYNGEDVLAWWLKASLHRTLGLEGESEALMNAHFLAPFEPTLRAYAFLVSEHVTTEPSPLVAALADNPDAMIEAAAQLHDAGLYEELAKWAEECRRHRDVPMLGYLLADALLQGSRMAAEAAALVQSASTKPINPPYPWRRVELGALRRLGSAFPNDARIQELLGLAG
jgi:hypothetical protein